MSLGPSSSTKGLKDSAACFIDELNDPNTTDPTAKECQRLISQDDLVRATWEEFKQRSKQEDLKELTKDEYEFFMGLKRTGDLETRIAAAQSEFPSVSSATIREAILETNKLTDSYAKHGTALRAHNKNLIAMLDRLAQSMQSSVNGHGGLSKQTELRLEKEISKLHSNFNERLAVLETALRDRAKETPETLTLSNNSLGSLESQFAADPSPYDHLLAKLQALGWEMTAKNPKEYEMIQAGRFHASEMVFLQVWACRDALNQVFMEAVGSYASEAPEVHEYSRAVEKETIATMDEIQSLWDEAVPVAHMAVEKEYLKPMLEKIDFEKERERAQQLAISIYVSGCLEFTNSRLGAVVSRIRLLLYHHECLVNAFAAIDSSNGKKSREPIQENVSRDFRRRLESTKRLTDAQADMFGLFTPGFKSDDKETRVTELEKYVKIRSDKGNNVAQTVHALFEAAVKAGLDNVQIGGEILLDCVLADAAIARGGRGAVLQDTQTEESIAALKADYGNVRQATEEAQSQLPLSVAAPLRPMFDKVADWVRAQQKMPNFSTEQVQAVLDMAKIIRNFR